MDGVVENGTHTLKGNPTMTLCLIAKGTFSHLLWIQEHDRDPFERTRGAPTRLNVFKCVLGTWIRPTNGTDIEQSIRGERSAVILTLKQHVSPGRHGGPLEPPDDPQPGQQVYINERLSLKSNLPGSMPIEYLSFCVRGKFCQLAQ
ncbi:hypothetical protein TNCV_2454581 [Trichonephila clavipes]|nr:hypothetical protein TNCV_2454581 [Trichonephila clavipes]